MIPTNNRLSPSLVFPEVNLLINVHLGTELKLKESEITITYTEGNDTPDLIIHRLNVENSNHVILYDISSELRIALYSGKALREKTNAREVRLTSCIIL